MPGTVETSTNEEKCFWLLSRDILVIKRRRKKGSGVVGHMPVIPELVKLRWEDCHFNTNQPVLHRGF